MPILNMTAVGAASYAVTTRNREKFLRDAEERVSRLAAAGGGVEAHATGAGAGAGAAGTGSVWDKRDVRKLRARKLLSLADDDSLTTTDLRALFRLLDEDGNHEVSALEIQSGLLLLGFEAAADPVALSRFLLDVDSDRTGTVTEDEFLSYFNNKTRAQMERDLNSYVVARSLVTATWYGAEGDERTITTEFVQGKDLRAWMAALPEGRGRLWLDVNGYDADCFGALAEALGKPEHEIIDAVLVGDARVDLVQGPSGPRAEIVLHTRELSVSPIRAVPRAIATYMPGPLRTIFEVLLGSDGKEDGILGNMDLVSRTAITEQMPAISLEQAAMIIVDEKTLLTLRLPAFGDEADLAHLRAAPPGQSAAAASAAASASAAAAVAGGSASASVAPDASAHPASVVARFASTEDPLAHDPSVIRRVYERVRQDMARSRPTATHLFSSSAKALAIALTDAILQQNHQLRDGLQDWQHVLERSIKRQPNSMHLPHLNAIDIITRLYTSRIQLLCDILDPASWALSGAQDAQDAAAEAAAEAEAAIPSAVKRAASAALLLERAAASPSSASAAGDGAGEGLAHVAASRAVRSMVEGTPVKRTSSRHLDVGRSPESQRPGGLLRLSTAAAGSEGEARSRGAFFAAFVDDFVELSKDLRSVLVTLENKRQKIDDLKALLSGLKADFMNKTLFVLTVITAVSVPITFLTGLFGMNFKDM